MEQSHEGGAIGKNGLAAVPTQTFRRGLRNRRLNHLAISATKPFLRLDETILKRSAFIRRQKHKKAGLALRTSPMIEAVALLALLMSASIFLAHAVEAYF
jgi:hypothetical protein